jgi:transglutaminase-like putative cysteine protease
LLLATSPASAAESGRLVEEFWEVAHLEGTRVGSVHTTVVVGPGPARRLRATAEMELTFRRYRAILKLRMEHGTEETPEGKVVGVFMRQHHAAGRDLVLAGVVDGDRLHVKVDGGRIERRLRWSSEVVGLYAQEHLFAKRKPKPGDRFTFLRYEPTLNTVVTVRVAVKDRETVSLAGKRTDLLRVELTPDRIVVPGHDVKPPGAVWWLNADFVPVRRQIEMEGLGTVILTRTTRASAAAGGARLADVGARSLVPLNRTIPPPHALRSVLYRVTLRGDANPGTALASDAHQEVRNVTGQTFELLVHPVRPGPGSGSADRPGPEFLASCHYIDSADERVKELARRAVGPETDPWRKALRIERWVKGALRVDNAAPLVPAGQVARSLRGDCRAYALLTAALCRAEGIPSRTAIGLLYVERGGRPALGFHMWAEVWVAGRWLGLDATLGRGGVGAGHVKVSDHSWYDTASLTPLLPTARILGKMAVEVVRIEAGR